MINNGIYFKNTKEAAKRRPSFKFYLYLFYDIWAAMLSTCTSICTTLALLQMSILYSIFCIGHIDDLCICRVLTVYYDGIYVFTIFKLLVALLRVL